MYGLGITQRFGEEHVFQSLVYNLFTGYLHIHFFACSPLAGLFVHIIYQYTAVRTGTGTRLLWLQVNKNNNSVSYVVHLTTNTK